MVKRGISPLIATVLLVAMGVALAALVSTYVIKQTKAFKPESFIEDSPYCEDLNLEPVISKDKDWRDVTPSLRQPWPKSVFLDPAAFTPGSDPYSADTLPLCSPSSDPEMFCAIEGIGFRNKGSFSVQSVLITPPGAETQGYIPLHEIGSTTEPSTIPPGKTWGYKLEDGSVVRNIPVYYFPNLLVSSRIFKVTPQVRDPDKSQKLGRPVVIPCSKQVISFDLKDICPRCLCPGCPVDTDGDAASNPTFNKPICGKCPS